MTHNVYALAIWYYSWSAFILRLQIKDTKGYVYSTQKRYLSAETLHDQRTTKLLIQSLPSQVVNAIWQAVYVGWFYWYFNLL